MTAASFLPSPATTYRPPCPEDAHRLLRLPRAPGRVPFRRTLPARRGDACACRKWLYPLALRSHCMSPRAAPASSYPCSPRIGGVRASSRVCRTAAVRGSALPAGGRRRLRAPRALLVLPFRWASSSAGRDRGWPSRVFPPLAIGWLGASGVLLTVTAVTDLGRLLFGLLHGWPDAAARAAPGAAAGGGHRARNSAARALRHLDGARMRLVLSRVRVPLEKPGSGHGTGCASCRSATCTSVHRIGEDFLRRVVDRVNALRPDVVAITGDLVDGPGARRGDRRCSRWPT